MDRITLKFNDTETVLVCQPVEAELWDLSGWASETSGDYEYFFNSPVDIESIPLGNQPKVLAYGTYRIYLKNGMYLYARYEEDKQVGDVVYHDYITTSGMYNADGTSVGTPIGTSGANYTNAAIAAIEYPYDDEVYAGFVIRSLDSDYGDVFLLNEAMYGDSVTDEPYDTGPEDPVPGGYGLFNRDTDEVGLSDIPPNLLPFGNGFNFYEISPAALKDFTDFLWGKDEGIWNMLWNRFQNYKFNPIGAIVACQAIPSEFMPEGVDSTSIKLAGTRVGPIGGTLKVIGTQCVDYTIGSIAIPDFSGTWLDFKGVTIQVHVPFCGVANIDPIYCMGGSIRVTYRCDLCTGNVTAHIFCTNFSGHTELIQSLSGSCSYGVPLTGHDDGTVEMMGKALNGFTSAAGSASPVGVAGSVLSTGWDLLTQKETTTVVGNMAGSSAYTSNLNCYAIISFAEPSNPDYYTALRGRPSDIGATVGSFSGWTVFSDVIVQGLGEDEEEDREIEALLKGGIIV